MKNILHRFSAYGDLWMRYLHWGARHCPWFMEPVMVFGFTMMFWVVLGKARRAVARNLNVLLPGSSPLVNQVRVIRVFWNFAWSMVDQAHVRHGQKCIRWEIAGDEHLKLLEGKKEGAILLTAHMGNYDVAAPLFAERIQRPIHLVRVPERHRESQEFQQSQRAKEQSGEFVIHYNEPGNMLGMDLARALQEGGVVAIQGDRILFDVSPMQVPFEDGVQWNIPRGPFLLALVAKASIHPVFIIRMGYRRYRVVAAEPIEVRMPANRDKEQAQRDAAVEWSKVVGEVMRRHWRQWFVFEPVFEAAPAEGTNQGEERTKPVAMPEVVDAAIPGRGPRSVPEVLVTAAATGCWTALVSLRWFLASSWGCAGCVLASLALWPVAWFFLAFGFVQVSLWVALAVMKMLRLPSRSYDMVVNGVTVVSLSGIGWREIQSGCPMGWWLGVLWFAGLGLSLVKAAVRGVLR